MDLDVGIAFHCHPKRQKNYPQGNAAWGDSEEGQVLADRSVERFIESISKTPLKPGEEDERMA